MTVTYRGADFDLAKITGSDRYFARTEGRDIWITEKQLKDWIRRGIMRVVTSGPGGPVKVMKATCDLCHTEHANLPATQPKCIVCEKTGCPECFHQLAMFTCDICDEVVCAGCIRTVNGFVICQKVSCKDSAKEETQTSSAIGAQAQKEQARPWRQAS